jgi:hypothetical protein
MEVLQWAKKGATHGRTLNANRIAGIFFTNFIRSNKTNYYTGQNKSHNCIYVTTNSITTIYDKVEIYCTAWQNTWNYGA